MFLVKKGASRDGLPLLQYRVLRDKEEKEEERYCSL